MHRATIATLLVLLSAIAAAEGPTPNLNAWLDASLYGNDNEFAALRRVTIEQTESGYRVNVKNQFNFACALEFDGNGDPARLSDCRTLDPPSPICNPEMPHSDCAVHSGCFQRPNEDNPACFEDWIVKEPQVRLSCHTLQREVVCTGDYTLTTTRGFTTDGRFTIARRR